MRGCQVRGRFWGFGRSGRSDGRAAEDLPRKTRRRGPLPKHRENGERDCLPINRIRWALHPDAGRGHPLPKVPVATPGPPASLRRTHQPRSPRPVYIPASRTLGLARANPFSILFFFLLCLIHPPTLRLLALILLLLPWRLRLSGTLAPPPQPPLPRRGRRCPPRARSCGFRRHRGGAWWWRRECGRRRRWRPRRRRPWRSG